MYKPILVLIVHLREESTAGRVSKSVNHHNISHEPYDDIKPFTSAKKAPPVVAVAMV